MFAFLKEGWPALLLVAAVAYLFGSISSAIIVTRLFSHKDIRHLLSLSLQFFLY